MWINNINPTILHMGPLEIRWYGLVYILGFFLTVFWLNYVRNKKMISLSKDDIWDFSFYLMLGVIIGSRLFEVFWEPQHYLSNPLNFFKIWEGGMSFHGGFVGIVTVAWIYCRKKKINFSVMADVLSLPTIFALALGRIANFINGELVGRIWNGKWCVIFPNYDSSCRHPSTIYAASKRFVVFGWLLFLSLKEEFSPGFIFWNFVFFEGLGRIIVDFFREDALYYGFSIGQWFSLIMVIAAFYVFLKYYRKDWKNIIASKTFIKD
ncbi:MAG: prolipoprotein diacylglyceryl transferase [Nanoarchaeota archaeon]|nr:prolipoprotein diacylglyceryl transferase [Nanoarchaeota archaeon]MBU1632377.1 prolipoprotein diacylglyceryl transferase [Nanoarchaeota archaeon]MBU1876721.1 prolipoprotein diacylglyceryl transferase [Nanoarchaeota archaeon]